MCLPLLFTRKTRTYKDAIRINNIAALETTWLKSRLFRKDSESGKD